MTTHHQTRVAVLLGSTRSGSLNRRIAEHRERGGGTLVTACAQSLHRFRTRGEPAVDLDRGLDATIGYFRKSLASGEAARLA